MANEYKQPPQENYIDGRIQLRFKGNVAPLVGTAEEVRQYFEIVEGSKDLDPDALRHAIRRQESRGNWKNNF